VPPPQLLELVKKSAEYLAARGIANARRESEWIFAEGLGLARIDLYTRFDMPLDPGEVERLRGLVVRRGKREPLAYVLGNQDFMGLKLTVSPAVLVPRPETEELVERVLAELPPGPLRLLDVGTGSGAIALALKRARPESAVEATDASEEALTVARANAMAASLEVTFASDHLAGSRQPPFDAVVANLPYVAESERGECDPELAFEPQGALFAADEGMALIDELIGDAPRLLAPAGALWLEHGWKQGERVRAAAAKRSLACDILADSGGKERFARLRRRDGA
jgi:release factor glutamine methyltransferase